MVVAAEAGQYDPIFIINKIYNLLLYHNKICAMQNVI